jgi:phage gp36-like protein
MAYIAQVDLENRLSQSTILQLYDDGNGNVNTAAIAAVLQTASDMCDAEISGSYGGPWPAGTDPTTGKYAAMLREAATLYAIALSFERHPEYVRKFGDDNRARGMYERAAMLCTAIANGDKNIVEATPKGGAIVRGGVVTNDANPMVCGVGGDWGT